MSSSATARDGADVVQFIPPAAIEQDILAMEKLLYALACDEPFSLELVGEVHPSTSWCAQTRKPCSSRCASRCRPITPGADQTTTPGGGPDRPETGRACPHRPVGAADQDFDLRQIQQDGTDPIIGLLASMEPVHKHELGK